MLRKLIGRFLPNATQQPLLQANEKKSEDASLSDLLNELNRIIDNEPARLFENSNKTRSTWCHAYVIIGMILSAAGIVVIILNHLENAPKENKIINIYDQLLNKCKNIFDWIIEICANENANFIPIPRADSEQKCIEYYKTTITDCKLTPSASSLKFAYEHFVNCSSPLMGNYTATCDLIIDYNVLPMMPALLFFFVCGAYLSSHKPKKKCTNEEILAKPFSTLPSIDNPVIKNIVTENPNITVRAMREEVVRLSEVKQTLFNGFEANQVEASARSSHVIIQPHL